MRLLPTAVILTILASFLAPSLALADTCLRSSTVLSSGSCSESGLRMDTYYCESGTYRYLVPIPGDRDLA